MDQTFRTSIPKHEGDREEPKNLLTLEEMWNRTLTVYLIAEELVCRHSHDLSPIVAQYLDERHWDVIGTRARCIRFLHQPTSCRLTGHRDGV